MNGDWASKLNEISETLSILSIQVKELSDKIQSLNFPDGRLLSTKSKTDKTVQLDTVYDVIKKSREDVTIKELKIKTGLDSRQLGNALFRLKQKGKIQPTGKKGVYRKK